MNHAQRVVDELIMAAYDTGYYSGKGEDGTEHHRLAIRKRNALKTEMLAILEVKDATIEALQGRVTDLEGRR